MYSLEVFFNCPSPHQTGVTHSVPEHMKVDIENCPRANTKELIARGGFGSPKMFVNRDDMYFGNDRLPLVEPAPARK